MPSPAELPPEHEDGRTLEQQVVDMFMETRGVLNKHSILYPYHEANPVADDLKEAVGELASDQLVELVTAPYAALGEHIEAGLTRLPGAASHWGIRETSRKLSELAAAAYVSKQDKLINGMLDGANITASLREDAPRTAISSLDAGSSMTAIGVPQEVRGTFVAASTRMGTILLTPENAPEDFKNWVLYIVDHRGVGVSQLVDIKIEEAS